MGNTSPMITAAIGGVIAVIIAFVVYPILQSAADTYYLEYTPHCEVSGESFARVYDAGADAGEIEGTALGTVTESSDACTVTNISHTGRNTVGTQFRSEHGVTVATVGTALTGTFAISEAVAGVTNVKWSATSEWVEVKAILEQYAGISTLILSILPILAVTGFLGISASNIYNYTKGGSDGIQSVVVQSIAGLIITIVGLYLAPTIMDFANDAFLVSTDGRYGIMAQFSTIIKLVFSFVPVVFNAGLLAIFAWQGVKAVNNIKGQGGGSPAGMMG